MRLRDVFYKTWFVMTIAFLAGVASAQFVEEYRGTLFLRDGQDTYATFTTSSASFPGTVTSVGALSAAAGVTFGDANTGVAPDGSQNLLIDVATGKALALRVDDSNKLVANNAGVDVTGELSITGVGTTSGILCRKSDGDIGQCTADPGAANGTCTCA